MNGKPFHRAARGIFACHQIIHSAQRVLYCMLDQSSDTGVSWLGQIEIARRIGTDARNVRKNISRLIDGGWLIPVSDSGAIPGKTRWARRYQINVKALIEFDPIPDADILSDDTETGREHPVSDENSEVKPDAGVLETGRPRPRNRTPAHRNRTQTSSNRLRPAYDRLNTGALSDFPPFLQGDPNDETPEPVMAALYAFHSRGAAGVSGSMTHQINRYANEYGEARVIECLKWAKENGQQFQDAMARVRKLTWEGANEKPAPKEGEPWLPE